MFGVGKGVTTSLVGWLWADLLLGMFAIFLAAAAAPPREALIPTATPQRTAAPQPTRTPQPTLAPRAVDPQAIRITIPIDGQALLSGDRDAVSREQVRIANEIEARLRSTAGARQVAVAVAFVSHQGSAEADRLARLGTGALRTGAFEGAFIKSYPGIVSSDGATTLTLELYLFR